MLGEINGLINRISYTSHGVLTQKCVALGMP